MGTSPRNMHWTYYTAFILQLSSNMHIAYLPHVKLSKKQTEALLNLLQIEINCKFVFTKMLNVAVGSNTTYLFNSLKLFLLQVRLFVDPFI